MMNYLKIALAFVITTVLMCIANFITQIVLIFIDVVSRWESSSALTIVLWIVTGVFGAVFTQSTATLFLNEKTIKYRLTYTTVLIISLVCIAGTVVLMVHGEFMEDPRDYTLFFSNGFVFVSYFIGTGGFAWIGRKLDS
jgi:hypothetical protein